MLRFDPVAVNGDGTERAMLKSNCSLQLCLHCEMPKNGTRRANPPFGPAAAAVECGRSMVDRAAGER